MALRIVTASGKGGVGKSTVCKGLGLQFASSGKRTLLIDCDAGLSSLDIMLGVADTVTFTWIDIIEDVCTVSDALISINENLSFLASPRKILKEDYENSLKEIIDGIEDDFDIIILDAPAGVGRGLSRAAKAASKALIVATADEISVKDAATVSTILSEYGISDTRLLINRYRLKSAKKGKFLTVDEIIDKTFVQLIGIIPEDENILYSTVSAKKLKTKKSDGAFMRISKRISGENIALTLSQLK